MWRINSAYADYLKAVKSYQYLVKNYSKSDYPNDIRLVYCDRDLETVLMDNFTGV
jgi:hypothetical protein